MPQVLHRLDSCLRARAEVQNFLDRVLLLPRLIAPNCNEAANFHIERLLCDKSELIDASIHEAEFSVVGEMVDRDAQRTQCLPLVIENELGFFDEESDTEEHEED